MEELRRHTDAVFRVDANAGWKLDEALELIPPAKDLGVTGGISSSASSSFQPALASTLNTASVWRRSSSIIFMSSFVRALFYTPARVSLSVWPPSFPRIDANGIVGHGRVTDVGIPEFI